MGLLDRKGVELKALDYFRLDMSGIEFRMSPPRLENKQVTFLNKTPIKFGPAKTYWGWVAMIAMFHDPMEGDGFCRVSLNFANRPQEVKASDALVLYSGGLIFDIEKMPWGDPPGEPEIEPVGPLIGLIRRFF